MKKAFLGLASAALMMISAGLASVASAAEYRLDNAIAFDAGDGVIASVIEVTGDSQCKVIVQLARSNDDPWKPSFPVSATEVAYAFHPLSPLREAISMTCDTAGHVMINTPLRLMLR